MQIWGQQSKYLWMRISCGGTVSILWFVQGDAAANDEDDEVLCDDGGARAIEGRERKKTLERGRMRKDQSSLFRRKGR